jgi:hypothetical protein
MTGSLEMPTSAAAAVATAKTETKAARLPWYCFATVFGAACIPLGALWDISWHSTIGRDTFWTPAHMLIYLGGMVPGFTAGWLALQSTFGRREGERRSAIRLWHFYAPLGAWVTIWGAMAMLISAPFDNWWHNAYGLDVEILSPPHALLAMGMYAVAIGALLLVLSWQNRHPETKLASLLFVFAAGVLLTMSTIIVTEESYPNQQHGTTFYKICCVIYPLYLCAAARAAKVRWAATGSALVYFGIMCSMVWILPLFKARPLLAPIYLQVDHMVPPTFPLLLFIPALAIDLLVQWFGQKHGFWRDTLLALCIGVAFFGLFVLVQWNFSKFMLSPKADNWFFAGNRHWPYFVHPGEWWFRFWKSDTNYLSVNGALVACAFAILKSRISLAVGSWMSRVQR